MGFSVLIGGPSIAFEYIESKAITQNGGSSYTFSINTGPATSGRIVLLAIWTAAGISQGAITLSSGTIAGQSIGGIQTVNATGHSQIIGYATVSTGTTASVTLNFSDGVSFDFGVNVFAITGQEDSVHTDYAGNEIDFGPDPSLSVTIDIPNEGIVIGISSDAQSYGTWTGADEVMQSDVATQQMTAASRAAAIGGETGATITCNPSRQLQAISWK